MTLLFIGTTELLLIAGVALLIFGGKKVPELMKGLGKGVQSFKQGMNEPMQEEKPEEVTDVAQIEPKEDKGAEQQLRPEPADLRRTS